MSKRRWLRPKQRISYYEPEEPDLDEYVFCEKCGDFVYEYCSIHGALLVIPDDKMYDRDRKPSHVVDASDGNKSNWMRFVNCARRWHEQNLVAFQYQGKLYYRTIKIIPRFTELMVFYGSEFANKLHIDLGKYNAPKSYAQLFGARVPKKPNTSPKNKKTQDVPVSIAKEQETETSQQTTINNNNTPTPNISTRKKKNNERKSKENRPETQKEKPVTKKRKTNAENKKFQPDKTTLPVENSKIPEIVREKNEDHIIKPGEEVKEPKNKKVSNIEQLNPGNKKQKITTNENNFTTPVGSTATSNKCIGKENLSAKIEQVGKTQRKEQNMDLKKTQDVYFTCNECHYQSVTKELLENHTRFHDVNRKFVCEICRYRFSISSHLTAHKLVHKKDAGLLKILECNICDYATVWGVALKNHLKRHTGEKPHACSICDFKCSGASNLKSHLRTHSGEKPHACSICGYKSSQASSLKRHLRTHSGDKPHACSICGYKSSQAIHLKTHLRTHSGEKPHACGICGYKSSQASNLKSHLRTHSGEKPHACSICGYKSSQASSLKRHLRTHSGDKPHACSICGYKSSQAIHLKTHLRTHSGEKPHACSICGYKCSQTSSLKKHLMRKHLN